MNSGSKWKKLQGARRRQRWFGIICLIILQPDRLSEICIFERRSGCKIIEQNVPGGLIFSGFSTMYISCGWQPAYPDFFLLQIPTPPLSLEDVEFQPIRYQPGHLKSSRGGRISIDVFIKREILLIIYSVTSHILNCGWLWDLGPLSGILRVNKGKTSQAEKNCQTCHASMTDLQIKSKFNCY